MVKHKLSPPPLRSSANSAFKTAIRILIQSLSDSSVLSVTSVVQPAIPEN